MTDEQKADRVVEITLKIRKRKPDIPVPRAGWLAIGHIPAIKGHQARSIHSMAMKKLNARADVAGSTPA